MPGSWVSSSYCKDLKMMERENPPPVLFKSPSELGVVAHTCNPSTQKAEATALKFRGQPRIYS